MDSVPFVIDSDEMLALRQLALDAGSELDQPATASRPFAASADADQADLLLGSAQRRKHWSLMALDGDDAVEGFDTATTGAESAALSVSDSGMDAAATAPSGPATLPDTHEAATLASVSVFASNAPAENARLRDLSPSVQDGAPRSVEEVVAENLRLRDRVVRLAQALESRCAPLARPRDAG